MAKKKNFFKKSKVKLSSSKVVLLSAIIIAVCVTMLTFSILFGQKTTGMLEKQTSSEQGAVPENPAEPEKAAAQPEPVTAAIEKPAANTETDSAPPETSSVNQEKTAAKSEKTSEQLKKTAKPKKTSEPKQSEKTASPQTVPVVPEQPAVPPASISSASGFEIPEVSGNPVLVFIFDDGGQNLSQLEKCLALPFPVTVAVLPGLVHSAESAQKVRSSGNELMLHQPMQALNTAVNPGPCAILPGMNADETEQQIIKNIAEIGPIAGFNNHEGSMILENKILTQAVLEAAAVSGVYFLDSRTTVNTFAPQVASEMDISIYSRDIFLDNVETRENVLSELHKGLVLAGKKGYCIMIGHVWSANLLPAILTELYPALVEKGYRFSVVSQSGASGWKKGE